MTTGTVSSVGEVITPTIGGLTGYTVPKRTFSRSWGGADRVAGEAFNAFHPYSMDATIVNRGLTRYKDGRFTLFEAQWSGGSYPSQPLITANDELELLGKLQDAIRGHDFNAGITVGEGAQSVGMIGSAAASLARGLDALQRGSPKQAILDALAGGLNPSSGRRPRPFNGRGDERLEKALSDRWLEASFGWMPLLSDIDAGAKALVKLRTVRTRRVFRVRIKRRVTETVVIKRSGGLPGLFTEKRMAESRVQLVYRLNQELDTPWDGWGLENPATIAWELVPWSFVIDWVLPVGDLIRSFGFAPRLKGEWCKTYTNKFGTIRNFSGDPDWVVEQPYTSNRTVMTRTKGVGGLSVPLPTFRNPFTGSWKRTLNQLALLGQLRG